MIILGLTGSIGMGKSTTATMFSEMGVPVNDADAIVHALYQNEAVTPIGAAFPGAAKAGIIDRTELSRQLAHDPSLFKTLEAIVHPLVREKERAFLDRHRAAGVPLVVLDIPLLFETKGESRVDAVAVVTCDPEIQKERVLKRPGMTGEKFALILSRQVPDHEKRAKADYVIDTGHGFDSARGQVAAIVQGLTSQKRP
jgi:dephospho-CoA kinase